MASAAGRACKRAVHLKPENVVALALATSHLTRTKSRLMKRIGRGGLFGFGQTQPSSVGRQCGP